MSDNDVYATVRMGFGAVNLYPAMDRLMAQMGEHTGDNMRAYQAARIKHLEAWCRDAFKVLKKGAELMPLEGFDHWEGVRAVMEDCPVEVECP